MFELLKFRRQLEHLLSLRIDHPDPPRRSTAVLVFASSQGQERARKKLPLATSRLFLPPTLDADSPDADVHTFDVHTFVEERCPPATNRIHRQVGHSFAARLNHAARNLVRLGYQRLVIVGTDCPQLSSDDIHHANILLDTHRLVIGPDHRGGCWLIALHAAEVGLLESILWKQNTDAAQLRALAGDQSVAMLEVKFDIDSIDDLHLLARWDARFACLLPAAPHEASHLIVASAHEALTIRWQLPPPLAA